jgi:hypothetical protein
MIVLMDHNHPQNPYFHPIQMVYHFVMAKIGLVAPADLIQMVAAVGNGAE